MTTTALQFPLRILLCWCVFAGTTCAAAFSVSTNVQLAPRSSFIVGPNRCSANPSFTRLSAANDIAPENMRVAEIKAELQEGRVDFTNCFDKESLVDKLLWARANPDQAAAPVDLGDTVAATDAAAPASVNPGDTASTEATNMRIGEIKAELNERRVDFSRCFDKESLVEKLLWARANPNTAPAPAPAGAATNANFGAESQAGSPVDMDNFAAAGWTGATSEPAPVDQARSPGMNRNFGDVAQSDFKKPYTGGG